MTRVLPLLLLLMSLDLLAQAEPLDKDCGQYLHKHGIQSVSLSEQRPLSFRNVEVFRRNNTVGLQQKGELIFEKWFEVGPESKEVVGFIGLTKEGRVYHLLQWKNRRIAYLLSGVRTIKDIFLDNEERLIAVDQNNQVWLYSPSKWLSSPLRFITQKGMAITVAGSAALWGTLAIFFPELIQSSPLVPAFLSVSIGFQTFFTMLARYEHLNNQPDGFISLDSDTKVEAQTWQPPDLSLLPPCPNEEACEDIR